MKSVDVIWFYEWKMPDSFYEIEHSTNIFNSLLKFVEFRDFHAKFYIVADNNRKKEFITKSFHSSFKSMDNRIQFLDYDTLSNWNAKVHELSLIENKILSV